MNGLTMGLSGVSLWGSDIGGFFALSEPQTTPELLARWIEFGFASGVMRTQANGFAAAPASRARRSSTRSCCRSGRATRSCARSSIRTSRRRSPSTTASGMPLMRHLALAFPDDPLATARADEYLLGRDLLVAPVMQPGRARAHALSAGGPLGRLVAVDHARRARRAPSRRAAGPGRRRGRDAAGAARRAAAARPRGRRDPAARPVRRDARRLRRGHRGAPARSHRAPAAARLAARRRTVSLGDDPGLSGQETVTSEETPAAGSWTIQGHRMRRYDIEAALGSLSGGAFEPCRVSVARPGRGTCAALALRSGDRRAQPAARCA